MQQSAGVINELYRGQNVVYEVFVDFAPDATTIDHVYICHGRRQIGDFPYGQPTNNRLEQAAQKLVESQRDSVVIVEHVPFEHDDDFGIIEDE